MQSRLITSGIAALQSTGATLRIPQFLSYLAVPYAQLGQFDDAWRLVNEAITTVETTKERWYLPDIYRIAGEVELEAPERDAAKAEGYFKRALSIALQQEAKVLGTPRLHEPRTPVARSGQAAAGARTARSDLRLVH